MLNLDLPEEQLQQVLCLGAHCDDIEIGCGGTLLWLAEKRPDIQFNCVIFSGDETRQQESRTCLARIIPEDRLRLQFFDFKDGYFPGSWSDIKDTIESLKSSLSPDLIFTHRRSDRHQDHNLLGELTWNTFRNNLILEYEIPKYEGDLATPNCYVILSNELLAQKSSALVESHLSQSSRSWFSEETFTSLARIRGIESGSSSGYAEGFHASKFLMGA